MSNKQRILLCLAVWTILNLQTPDVLVRAFTVGPYHNIYGTRWLSPSSSISTKPTTRLFAASALDLPELSTMKPSQMREELESYGISTKSFLEKSELKEALEKARAEGKVPINGSSTKSSKSQAKSPTTSEQVNGRVNGKSSESSTSSSSSSESRSERLAQEMEKAKGMSVGELRKELTSRGVSTKSFFEKSEFIKAYAEAVVDGTAKKQQQSPPKVDEEPYDPSYRDVTVQKMPRQEQQRLLQGVIIDIPLKK
ncbi:hypothetical protein ACA910_000888 [Epithemia clementina (nom. ined.)]